MGIKIVASDQFAAILTRDELDGVLTKCRMAVGTWGWSVWVETYPEEADDGSLNQFRIVMGPTFNTHPSYYFTRFYGGPDA